MASEAQLKWELERPEDRKRWWVRDDMYTPVPRTPLSDSIYTAEWDEAVLCIGEELSFPDSRGFNARTVNGYTYLSPMPITDPDLIQKRLTKFLAKMAELQANVERDLARYHAEQDRELAYWKSVNLADPNLMTLLEHWRRVLVTADRFWKLHFLIVFPRHVVAGMFEQAAREIAGIQSSPEIGKLVRSMGKTRQLELDMELWRLAGRAIELGLKDTFLGTLEEKLVPALQSSEKGRVWLGEFNRFLETYGARTSLPLELHDRSWQEDPTPVLATLRSYVAQGGQYNFDRLTKDMAEERDRLTQSALAGISDPEAREKFRGTLESARKFQFAMEDDNYYFLWAVAQVRKVAMEIGKRLAAAGVLDDADDVFFLRKEELARALVDLATVLYDMRPYGELARARRAEYERALRTQAPPYIGDLPEELNDFMLTQFWGIHGRKQLDDTRGAIRGLGASGGVAEGTARLMVGPNDFARIQPGDVLLCRATSEAWTPLFSKVAAVVTDQGGTLSHAAIVSREYGIPAVVGTGHATRRIPDGARVRVDGNEGTVQVV